MKEQHITVTDDKQVEPSTSYEDSLFGFNSLPVPQPIPTSPIIFKNRALVKKKSRCCTIGPGFLAGLKLLQKRKRVLKPKPKLVLSNEMKKEKAKDDVENEVYREILEQFKLVNMHELIIEDIE